MNRLPSRIKSRGLSLIEIMIALAIGSLLLLGLVQVFSASRAAYQQSEGMARTQENARFAMDFLQRDLRMAGHFGCINDQSHLQNVGAMVNWFPAPAGATWGINFPIPVSVPLPLGRGSSIAGYDATNTAPGNTVNLGAAAGGWVPPLPAAVAALAPLAGTDVIELRFFSTEGLPVTNITNPIATQTVITVPAAQWATLTANGVANPTMFGISDCSFADVFPALAVNPGAGEVTVNAFINRYTPQPAGTTMLYRAESLVYYIGTGASGAPALFRARANNAGNYALDRQEMVEGIESLQMLYGLDTTVNMAADPPTGFINTHVTAAAVLNNPVQWRRVGMVQVGILSSSPDVAASPDAAQNPSALGIIFNPPVPADSRYRAVYETTIALRNRLYGN